LLAIVVAVAVALLGSVLIQSVIPINDVILSPLEKKCQEIANEGYKIHTLYPTSNPDELLEADMKRLLYLDNMWIKECVSILPAESIINIVNNVEREISYGE
jgi:hypothetical protein